MAIIYSYPSGTPTTADFLIGTQASSGGGFKTKSFTVGSIVALAEASAALKYVPYTGATTNVNLGIHNLTATTFTGAGTGLTGTATSLNIGGNAATVTTNANLTGVVTSLGNATSIADGALSIAKTNGLQLQLDSRVPYTGATTNVNLGTRSLTTTNLITTNLTTTNLTATGDVKATTLSVYDNPNGGYSKIAINDSYFTISRPAGNTAPMLSVEDGSNLILTNSNGAAAQIVNNLTVSRNYTLPNASGTLALTSDLTNLVTTNTVQTITGTKTFNGGLIFDAEQAVIAMLNQYDTGASIGITLFNTATDPEGLRVNNNNNGGTAIAITNSLSGYGFYGNNSSNGILMALAASASSTGDLLRCTKNSVITTKVDTNGNITAPSFVKTGSPTPAQFLMSDGSISTGGGTTNLSTTRTATDFTINSNTGDDALVPLGDGTLAGASLNNYTTTEKNKLAGTVSGSGTLNYIAKFTAAGAVGNSNLFDVANQVLIGTTVTGNVSTFSSSKLVVANNITSGTFPSTIEIRNLQTSTSIVAGNSMGKLVFSSVSGQPSGGSGAVAFSYGAIEALAAGSQSSSGTSGGILRFLAGGAGTTGQTIDEVMRIDESGNALIGTTDGSASLGGYTAKLVASSAAPTNIAIRNTGYLGIGTKIGGLVFQGAGTSAGAPLFTWAAVEALCVSGPFGSNSQGGELRFSTVGDGIGNTPSVAMTIDRRGSVGISSTSINQSAVLEVSSTTKGFLPPRMTQANRGNISLPTPGLCVYCTDLTNTFHTSSTVSGNVVNFEANNLISFVLATFSSKDFAINSAVIITGAQTGSGGIVDYVIGKKYFVIERTQVISGNVKVKLSETRNGVPVTLTIGTCVGLTFQNTLEDALYVYKSVAMGWVSHY